MDWIQGMREREEFEMIFSLLVEKMNEGNVIYWNGEVLKKYGFWRLG